MLLCGQLNLVISEGFYTLLRSRVRSSLSAIYLSVIKVAKMLEFHIPTHLHLAFMVMKNRLYDIYSVYTELSDWLEYGGGSYPPILRIMSPNSAKGRLIQRWMCLIPRLRASTLIGNLDTYFKSNH